MYSSVCCLSPSPIVFDSVKINSIAFSASNIALAGPIPFRSDANQSTPFICLKKTHKLPKKNQVINSKCLGSRPSRFFSSHRNAKKKIYHQPRNTSQKSAHPPIPFARRNTARPTVPQTHNYHAELAAWEGKIQLSHPL